MMNEELQKQYKDPTEIDLVELIRVPYQKKWLILSIALIISALSFLMAFSAKKSFEGSAIIEVGEIEHGTLIENTQQIKEKVLWGLYGERPVGDITITTSLYSNIVSIQAKLANKEETKQFVNRVTEAILREHKKILDSRKSLKETELANIQKIVKIWEQKGAPTLENSYNRISALQTEINSMRMSRVLKEPTVREISGKSKSFLIVFMGFSLGLFFGILAAYGKDWWEKNKLKIKS